MFPAKDEGCIAKISQEVQIRSFVDKVSVHHTSSQILVVDASKQCLQLPEHMVLSLSEDMEL